jgi:hypothetical protein
MRELNMESDGTRRAEIEGRSIGSRLYQRTQHFSRARMKIKMINYDTPNVETIDSFHSSKISPLETILPSKVSNNNFYREEI